MNPAAIKIAQKQAGLGDPAYRALLARVAGVKSSKELTEEGYRRVLAELYRIRDAANPARPAAARPLIERSPAERKLWALWYELKKLLPPPERTDEYFLGIIRRASGVATLATLSSLGKLTPSELYHTTEALKLRLKQEQNELAAAVGSKGEEVPF